MVLGLGPGEMVKWFSGLRPNFPASGQPPALGMRRGSLIPRTFYTITGYSIACYVTSYVHLLLVPFYTYSRYQAERVYKLRLCCKNTRSLKRMCASSAFEAPPSVNKHKERSRNLSTAGCRAASREFINQSFAQYMCSQVS